MVSVAVAAPSARWAAFNFDNGRRNVRDTRASRRPDRFRSRLPGTNLVYLHYDTNVNTWGRGAEDGNVVRSTVEMAGEIVAQRAWRRP